MNRSTHRFWKASWNTNKEIVGQGSRGVGAGQHRRFFSDRRFFHRRSGYGDDVLYSELSFGVVSGAEYAQWQLGSEHPSLGAGHRGFLFPVISVLCPFFLIRNRYREFGLYHILGMDKGNVWRVMVWDGIFVALLALGIGQVFGIVFSELSELALLRLLHEEVAYGVQISLSAVGHTLLIYGGIRLTFAFPLLWKMMQLFNLFDLPLAIAVTLVFFVVFVLFYAVVYKITSNSYYAIVNEEKV